MAQSTNVTQQRTGTAGTIQTAVGRDGDDGYLLFMVTSIITFVAITVLLIVVQLQAG